MKVAIASGKGGTGKSTVASGIAMLFAERGLGVTLLDCDVEEPNQHLLFAADWSMFADCRVGVPVIDEAACLGGACRKCVTGCRFSALAYLGAGVLVFPELCHGCGLCEIICPVGAVTQGTRDIGVVRTALVTAGGTEDARSLLLRDGLLHIGEAMASPLIRAVKEGPVLTEEGCESVQVWDCPPGTACSAINALEGADLVVLVAEPTRFGLHDLQLAVGLVRTLGLPFGVVINRDGIGDGRVAQWLAEEGIALLGQIPFSPEAARVGAEGGAVSGATPATRAAYERLAQHVYTRLQESAR